MLTRSGFHIFRIFGINIDADYSWLLILLLVVWQLGDTFSGYHPDWPASLQWGLAVIAALLFFGSVVLHELAHSLVAKARGVPVHRIVLFLFGGVSNIEREPPSAGAEFLIAIVGPLTSMVLGVFCMFLGGAFSSGLHAGFNQPGYVIGHLGPVETMLMWLGSINLILGVFNLVPGFPLDGGRVLRSIIWGVTGNLKRSTRYASWVGQAIALIMMFAGVSMIFGATLPYFGTGVGSGIWLLVLGWFLNGAAAASYRQVVVHDILAGVPVSRIMRTRFNVTLPSTSVSQVVYENLLGGEDRAVPVVDSTDQGRLLGLVCVQDVRQLPRDTWDTTPVSRIMTPADKLEVVGPNQDAADALTTLGRRDVGQIPVVENGRLVGMLLRSDLVRWMQLHADQGDGPQRMAA